jgi:hypothetical protein
MARASRTSRGPSRSRKNIESTAKNSFATLRPTPPISFDISIDDCSSVITSCSRIAVGSAESCSSMFCAQAPIHGRSCSAGGSDGFDARNVCTFAYALTASTRTIRISHASGTTMASVTSIVVSSAASPLRPRTTRTMRCCKGQLT